MSHSQPNLSSRNRNALRESALCQFPFQDGRRCRMLRHPAHPNLCPFHARAELQLRESALLGTELSETISGEFNTATDVNHVLGKLYTAIAQDRIPARNAAALAYVGQLLLQSVHGVKSEFKFSYSFDEWNRMNNETKPLSPPPSLSLTVEPPAPTDPVAPDTANLAAAAVKCDETTKWSSPTIFLPKEKRLGTSMNFIRVEIVRFVDAHQPGWAECEFEDAEGRRHVVRDKVPIFTGEVLDADSRYPMAGVIRCEVLERFQDATGREMVRVGTAKPDGVESVEGLSEFVVPVALVGAAPH